MGQSWLVSNGEVREQVNQVYRMDSGPWGARAVSVGLGAGAGRWPRGWAEAGRRGEALPKTFVQTGPPGERFRSVVARKHVTLFLARLPSSLLQVVRDARAEICNLQCEFQHKFICGPNWHLRKTVKCFSILAILSRNLFRENQSFKNHDSVLWLTKSY